MKSKMFKKSIAVILAVLTALSVLAFAPVTADAAAIVTTASQKTFTIRGASYSYYMPKINLSSYGANLVNADIKSQYDSKVSSAQTAANKGYSPTVTGMYYTYADNKGIVSVVLEFRYDGNYSNYHVYNLRKSDGKILNNDEVAKAFSTTYAAAKSVVKWKIKDEFYNLSAAAKKNSPWQTQRSRSITDSNLNNTVLCAGPNGLKAYYYIYWIAGAERYVHNTLVYSTSNPTVNAHGTNNGAQITWGKVSGVPKYRVYKKVNGSWKKLGDTKGTSFVDKSAKAGNTYYYTVRGVTGDSSAFMTGYNTSGKALRFLYTPQITKLETSDVGIKLTWNNAYTGVKYRVYFKNSSGKWQNLGDVSGSSVNCYCYGSGGKFTYTVRAVSSDGKQFLSGYNTSGKGMKWVSTPQISSLYNTPGGVQLSWNKPTGTEKFRIYRKTGNGSWQKLADTTATSFKDSSARNGVTYSYTVRCISSSGKSFQSYYNTTGKKITCYR